MSFSIETFDNLGFEIVKQKYYNANKVNAKMAELKEGVSELIAENEALKAGSGGSDELAEAAEALMASAQNIADAKVNDANTQAESIIADAKAEAEKIIAEAKAEAEKAAAEAKAQNVVIPTAAGFTEAQLDIIDELNRQLDSLSTSQATQIFKIKQQLMKVVIG